MRTFGLGAILTLGVICGAQDAGAQNIASFKVVGEVQPFDFSVNGTTVTNANLNSLLNSGNGSVNTVQVGWTPPPKGTPIQLQYIGAGESGFGTTLRNGDVLNVYAIAGVLLTNAGSMSVLGNINTALPGGKLTSWSGVQGSALPASWSTDTNAKYVGYKSGFSNSNGFPDILGYTNTGSYDGKNFTGANQDGVFRFNNISFDSNTATYLGMDVFVDVFRDGQKITTAQTGRLRVESMASVATVAPEGYTLTLMAFGLLPLAAALRKTSRTPA